MLFFFGWLLCETVCVGVWVYGCLPVSVSELFVGVSVWREVEDDFLGSSIQREDTFRTASISLAGAHIFFFLFYYHNYYYYFYF